MPLRVGLYDKCNFYNEDPKKIFSVCIQILELQESVPLTQLPEFISEQVEKRGP